MLLDTHYYRSRYPRWNQHRRRTQRTCELCGADPAQWDRGRLRCSTCHIIERIRVLRRLVAAGDRFRPLNIWAHGELGRIAWALTGWDDTPE